MSDYSPFAGDYNGLTKPIVKVWGGLIDRAKRKKERFQTRCDQIMSFYSGGPGEMWSDQYRQRFMGGTQSITPPRFKITLNVAFEQVAILGPMLFWEMADRKAIPHRSLQIDPSVLAAGNPEAEQYFAQLADQQAIEDAKNQVRAQLVEHMLNYFQREQPGGGLSQHSELMVFELLTMGAAFLKTEHYQFPFSEKTLVGSFFQSAQDVFVDPDCNDPLWQTADWIAIRHKTKVDATEEHFGLPHGSLRQYATKSTENASHAAGKQDHTPVDVEKDLIEWYEIYSRAGFGNHLSSRTISNPEIAPEFDMARGRVEVGGKLVNDDFVYLCICPTCDWPLNLPSYEFEQDYATPSWIKEKTNWPTEYWRDNKWPIELITAHPHDGKDPWPEPPLAPALGELTCLNILMSAYVQESFEGRQTIIAHRKGAVQDLQGLLNSDKSPLAVEIDPQFNETIQDVIQFMKRPEVNGDLPKTIEFLLALVKKRTGLLDEIYGATTGAEPRSAAAYQGKMESINIRPEHLQKKIAAMHSRVADKEVFCAYTHVSSRDIADQLGPLGSIAWDMYVTEEAPEAILRGCRIWVEANSISRPNRAKDMADLQGMQQFLVPVLAQEMAQTRNVRSMNGFIKAMGEAGQFDVSEMLLPEPQPDEMQDQMQQAELDKVLAETEKLRAEAHSKAGENDGKQQEAQVKMQVAEHGMDIKERQAQLATEQKQMEMEQKGELHRQSLEQRIQEARQKLALQLMQSHQSMQQSEQQHQQQMSIAQRSSQDEARRGNMITNQKLITNWAMAQQRANQQGRPA